MKIAVIGGGAAGVAATWLLSARHRVTLFERAGVLGGHIRTVGQNAPCAAVPADRPLEAGVVEFDRSTFHGFRALMADLDVELRPVRISTTLQTPSGLWRAPGHVAASGRSWIWRLAQYARLLPQAPARRRFFRDAAEATAAGLRHESMATWLPEGSFGQWMRVLLTYAYSTPYRDTRAFPAELGVPILRHFMGDDLDWVGIQGGVYTWVERAASRWSAEVELDAAVDAVHRRSDGVTLTVAGATRHFDAVVLATSPGQIPRLLADADADEQRRFGAWRDHDICTLVHRDRGLYDRRGVDDPTAFDLFVDGETGGYNAVLDDICRDGIAGSPTWHSLSLDVDHLIDPAQVLHRQPHVAPCYTVAAFRHRHEVIAHNGHRRTWIAGAWLGEGLHEGAISSGMRVAEALGGRLPKPVPAPPPGR